MALIKRTGAPLSSKNYRHSGLKMAGCPEYALALRRFNNAKMVPPKKKLVFKNGSDKLMLTLLQNGKIHYLCRKQTACYATLSQI